MNLRVLATALALSIAFALIGFGLHQSINAALGLESSLFNSVWQTLAVAFGASILIAFAYPHARGIKAGDRLVAQIPRAHSGAGGVVAFIDNVFVTALENGRKGGKIKVRLSNGRTGEGIIDEYAGTFSPPVIRITETESN